jgi:endonuclease G
VLEPPDGKGVTLPVPHGYFKSILTEDRRGNLHMWSFMMPNKGSNQSLETYLVPTVKVEQYVGIELWNRLTGVQIEAEKENVRKMWT